MIAARFKVKCSRFFKNGAFESLIGYLGALWLAAFCASIIALAYSAHLQFYDAAEKKERVFNSWLLKDENRTRFKSIDEAKDSWEKEVEAQEKQENLSAYIEKQKLKTGE